MGYLEDFTYQINKRDFHKFFQLWEEYCTSDVVDPDEFLELLRMIKQSDFSKLFGQFVETALPLWQCVHEEDASYEILKTLIDLQTTNAPILAETALTAIKNKFGQDPHFKERLRQVGLRSKDSFQGAISNYELLHHLEVGNTVFHTGGWGTGEVIEASLIREQVAIEFEHVAGIKHLSFDNAFKTLIPLPKDHFLSRRFLDPDKFEKEAKEDPMDVIKTLLRDLGPKTAAEIKDEMCMLVIPENEWSKWWQTARTKLKKDTMIETPSSLREPFKLRKTDYSPIDRLHQDLERMTSTQGIVQAAYSFARDYPQNFRKKEVKDPLKEKLLTILNEQKLSPEQELQIVLFLDSMFSHQVEGRNIGDFISSINRIDQIINEIDIIAFKKRALVMVRQYRDDYKEIFGNFLFSIQPNSLKDYILKELNTKETKDFLTKILKSLISHPEKYPETCVWYFQKVAGKAPSDLPFSDKEGQCKFLEGLLILLHKIEHQQSHRDLVKKIYNLLTAKRYAIVRKIIENTSIEFIKEFILLVSKCHTFADHEKKVLRSLGHVVHPSLAPAKKTKGFHEENNILWTTEKGYLQTQERIKQIATVEMIENAKEVEAARELGDLRENAEYKFACERRSRLQGEMKMLSKQLNKARVITPHDVSLENVGVGNIVELASSENNRVTYTILGPWEADPEEFIISYKSKLAQAMAGYKIGETFTFRDEDYTVISIKSFLDL